ncbi:MAG TPA: hypothetical protein VMW65_16265, partial [Chloroflexota bacterium]|nr:hypothetical protein [Chloroflexota bacterium]
MRGQRSTLRGFLVVLATLSLLVAFLVAPAGGEAQVAKGPPPPPPPGGNTCNSSTSIASNFNAAALAGGNYVWFSSVFKAQGVGPSTTVNFYVTGQTIQFNGLTENVPDAVVTFSPSATQASTTFDTTNNRWVTTIPNGGPLPKGNFFLSGLSFPIPAGGLPGGINPVTWNAQITTDTPGATLSWQWAAAVYTSFSTDNNALGVKPVDDPKVSQYQNSDHAGTPENFKTSVINGARGGGGSNYTGSLSPTASVTPCTETGPTATPTATNTPGGTLSNGQVCYANSSTPGFGATLNWQTNADGSITIFTQLATSFVDNTYGANAIGWPNGHKFSDLVGSDQIELTLNDANNQTQMKFKLDYITQSSAFPSGYGTLGVSG